MRGLPENWDGYGAAAPVANAVDLAQAFAAFLERALARPGSEAPFLHVNPTRIGGVLIEWEDPEAEHELEINPDQCISFLHHQKASGQITTRRFTPGGLRVVDPGLLQELRQLLAA